MSVVEKYHLYIGVYTDSNFITCVKRYVDVNIKDLSNVLNKLFISLLLNVELKNVSLMIEGNRCNSMCM